LAALEAVRMIRASGRALKRPLQVVSFIEEEGTRFQGLSGSQLATGSISEEEAAALTDAEGNRLLDLLATIDFPHPVDRHLRLDRGAAAFVEVHIEQGKRLERQGKQIGVVTGVAGPTFAQLTLTGRADHAGATDYADRHDTLLAAADVIHSVYDLGTGRFAGKARLTVGAIKAQPNATNVIAGKTTLKIDYRAGDDDTYATIPSVLEQRVVEIAAKRQVQHELRTLHRVAPIHFAADVIDAVTAAAAAAGLTQVPLVSWAAHDAMVMAEVCAAGMIFVPCRDGRSHTPEEYVSPEHIAAGVATLANTLLELST
jgi:hydantoinase/carbamoylase family amidase